MTDAHNHLQQMRDPQAALRQAREVGLQRMVVNGTCEADWPEVARLAESSPIVLPAYGLHPWQVPHRSDSWLAHLREALEKDPQASVGECGLDRWKKPFDLPDQVACLRAHLDLALELGRPVTIHCLQAWGPLLELLQSYPTLPPFLLHAYSGSAEMAAQFAKLGAYFSFSGYFLHPRKGPAREAFRQIPLDRILLETDAPAMLPPDEFRQGTRASEQNHPANLVQFLSPLAKLLEIPETQLRLQLEENFEHFTTFPPPLTNNF